VRTREPAVGERERGRRVASVGRVGDVLDLFDGEPVEVGLSEAAARLKLSKSAAHALFSTLVDIGLLEKTEASRYRLGWRLLVLGRDLLSSLEFRGPVVRAMNRFAAECGDTMHLAVCDRGRVVYVHRAEGRNAAGLPTQVGVRLFAHGSAVGKVLLAELAPAELGEVAEREGMPALTARTTTAVEPLTGELERVRERGFALDRGETVAGISCVGVPIRGLGGEVVAAMSVCAPSERFEHGWSRYARAAEATARLAAASLRSRGANVAGLAAGGPL
jgi:DNA-binding IclR family transcriptional regulator